jgi:uncharacterized membrane protein YdjX (TVP38/TMEM64 family)
MGVNQVIFIDSPSAISAKRNIIGSAILISLLLAILFMAARRAPAWEWALQLKAWIASLGALAPLAFIAAYAAGTVLFIPGWILSIIGGALFGPMGILYVIAGATLGACAAFGIARSAGRRLLEKRLAGSAWFQRINGLLESNGFAVVALFRLMPAPPFAATNYAMGLSRVDFRAYATATAIFIAPGAAGRVLGGDAIRRAFFEGEGGAWVALSGAAVLISGGVALSLWAKRRLASMEEERETERDDALKAKGAKNAAATTKRLKRIQSRAQADAISKKCS